MKSRSKNSGESNRLNFKLVTVFIVFSCLILLISGCNKTKYVQSVTVSKEKILLENEPYFIKGICYHPVPVGSNERSFTNLSQDLELMVEAGINTIRLYSPIDDIEVLDQIHHAGIKVIIGFGYNQSGYFDILSGSFIDYIEKYKNHPAVLFWELGNEYNYHPEWFKGDIKNWYYALNHAAKLVKAADVNHPVSTAHGELPDSLALAIAKEIDIWGMNVYRWDNPEEIFTEWESKSSKPMYLAEAGADSYMVVDSGGYAQGDNEKAQADAIRNILNDIFKNSSVCSGLAIFAFSDEWWKAGNPEKQDQGGFAPYSTGVPYDGAPNEEYWGIVKVDRTKKKAFNTVKEMYLNKK